MSYRPIADKWILARAKLKPNLQITVTYHDKKSLKTKEQNENRA